VVGTEQQKRREVSWKEKKRKNIKVTGNSNKTGTQGRTPNEAVKEENKKGAKKENPLHSSPYSNKRTDPKWNREGSMGTNQSKRVPK